MQFSVASLLYELSVNLIYLSYDSLDYPGVGPEHSYLKDLGRAEYNSVTDQEALEGNKIY